jgi:hypothetical protein
MARYLRPYQWPASKLRDAETMHDLHVLSKYYQVPITRIVADGVREYITVMRDSMDKCPPPPAPIGFATAAKPQQQAAG